MPIVISTFFGTCCIRAVAEWVGVSPSSIFGVWKGDFCGNRRSIGTKSKAGATHRRLPKPTMWPWRVDQWHRRGRRSTILLFIKATAINTVARKIANRKRWWACCWPGDGPQDNGVNEGSVAGPRHPPHYCTVRAISGWLSNNLVVLAIFRKALIH
jgi:hypothetical protein